MKCEHYLVLCILVVTSCVSIGCEEIRDLPIISDDPYEYLPEIGLSVDLEPGRYILRNYQVADREYKMVELDKKIGTPDYCEPADTIESSWVRIRLEPDHFGNITYINQYKDDIVVEIDQKIQVFEVQRSTLACNMHKIGFITYHEYSGRVIKNLGQPEDIFKYEIDPANPDAIVKSDQVSIETELQYPVFETAEEAFYDENFLRIINNIFSWIYSNCPDPRQFFNPFNPEGSSPLAISNSEGSSREYTLYFTHRNEREKFIGYLHSIFPLGRDFESVWSINRAVHVFEDTNYFYLYFDNIHPVIDLLNCPATFGSLD